MSILVRAMTKPHRDEPYWECLHHPAVLLIPKSVMLSRAGAPWQCGTRSRSIQRGRYRTLTENEANLSSYVGKTSKSSVRSHLLRDLITDEEKREKKSFFSITIYVPSMCRSIFRHERVKPKMMINKRNKI